MKSAVENSLLEIISCMLSQNPEVRRIAEERNKALQVMEGELPVIIQSIETNLFDTDFSYYSSLEYGVHLLDIILTTNEALEERQMAAILLNQYIQNFFVDEKGLYRSLVPSSTKEKIKLLLPKGLADKSGKIRNHIADILAWIAIDDYPEEWSTMCEVIFPKQEHTVERALGAIEFIKNYGTRATVRQLDSCYDDLYNTLFDICIKIERYSPTVRTEAVHCAANIICAHIGSKKVDHKDVVTITNFCELFANQLILPHPEQSNYDLKSKILKGYTLLLCHIPETIVDIIVKFLPIIWQILSRCGEVFNQVLSEDITPERDHSENPDEEPKFYILAFDIFDVLYTLLDTHRCSEPIASVLPDLLYYTILFMAIPKETELLWRNSPENYLAGDFNEDHGQFAVRYRAKDLLLLFVCEFDAPVVLSSLTTALNKHLQCAKLQSQSYYWRIMDAVMFAIGSIDGYVITRYNSNQLLGFNILHYLTQFDAEIRPCQNCLLLARILWIGGKYSSILQQQNISMYLATTIHYLRETSFILRYSAIRAIGLHLSAMSRSQYRNAYMEMRLPISHALMYALENSEGSILDVGLRALEDLLKIEPSLIETIQAEIIHLMHHLYAKTVTYPEITNGLQPIISQLSHSNNCWKNFESRFLSITMNTINDAPSAATSASYNYDTLTCAIKFITTMVKYSPEPLSENLIRCGFFGIYNCMMTIEEGGVIQSGAECLRSYLFKASAQITTFTDQEGRTGADYIVNVLKYTLDPQKMEFACRQIGRLCTTAMHTLNALLDVHIDFLLRGVLSAMQRANQTPIEEGLLVIFAYLFHNNLEQVVTYLTSIPGPHGESALQFVLNKWLSKNVAFGGRYQRNLSTLALARLLEHTILKRDERIIKMKVHNEACLPLHSDSSFLKKTEVPVPLKILNSLVQLLTTEMPYVREAQGECFGMLISKAEDPPVHSQEIHRGRLSDTSECGEIERSDSYDVLDALDPVYNLKLQDFLTNFFKNIANNALFCEWSQFLDKTEKITLFRIGISVPV